MKMQKRNALGRGLDSLISMGDMPADTGSAINEIELARIDANPEQPRSTFDEETLQELADSIRELGIIQPLSLRMKDDGRYQIIAGERRWRAAQMAGLTTVPAYVRTVSDSEMTEMALIENIQREDLNAIEVALTFRKLIDTYSLTQERLSVRLGKKRATIANHLRLLKLPAEIQIGLRDRRLDMGHARALLSVENPKQQLRLYNLILKEGLSVRRVEEMAREINIAIQRGETPDLTPVKKPAEPDKSPECRFFTEEMTQVMPATVKFRRGDDGKGSITLKFDSDEQLHQLMQLFEKLK
ncbi:MAG: ParB/RepB/Spo0J family partition protein [Muribaculaceae bacterium]|nr:ParB/RepB/Spo0J family partition protein [Muribaculaceae bacterium]MDE7080443.1 ParB/RepB/Spo0J family partition protein [Muribaculaceae bacterium]